MATPGLPTVMLVEDDARLAGLVSQYLSGNGFRVTVADLATSVADAILQENPDLVILDLGLPGQDGFSICRQLRPRYTNPILILTARDSDMDHVLGLELGADDFVSKPVEPRVLMARIHALLRRVARTPVAVQLPNVLAFGRLTIDAAARAVRLEGREITLSTSEFDLLHHLASHAGEVQSREALFRELHNRDYDGVDRLLDIRVSHLRKKLGDDERAASHIKTVWGQGYLFAPGEW